MGIPSRRNPGPVYFRKFRRCAIFPDCPAVVYGEGYGAGIQGGGDYSPTKQFIVFDVLVDGKWWLSDANMRDVADKMGLNAVPFIGEMALESATLMVQAGFRSRLNGGKKAAEGLDVAAMLDAFKDFEQQLPLLPFATEVAAQGAGGWGSSLNAKHRPPPLAVAGFRWGVCRGLRVPASPCNAPATGPGLPG
jgi:hypothetical protein